MTCRPPRKDAVRSPVTDLSIAAIVAVHSFRDKEEPRGTQARRTEILGRTIPQLRLRVEPIGARRLPNLNILNLRVEKSFRTRGAQRVGLRADIYNTLNINTETAVTPLSGPNFLRPSAITPPRFAELGLTYSF